MKKKKGKQRMIAVDEVPIIREVGRFVTVSLAAEMISSGTGQPIKDDGVYYLIRAGRLKGARLDRRTWLVRRSSVDRLVRERAGGEA